MVKKSPIGVFDSGVGGLSITHSIRRELPSENIIYVADFKCSPYGNKSKEVIEDRSEYIVEFLFNRGCKAIVVACNTATVNSIGKLRRKFNIPIVGVEPGIKSAAKQSNSGVIAVLATERTIKSASFKALKSRFSHQVRIEVKACQGFVELVEDGDLNSETSIKVVNGYILPLLSKGADHIVLGCTHYSFLTPVIEKIVEGKATIIDTAKPVALELKNRLTNLNILHPSHDVGEVQFFSTDTSSNVSKRISDLWGCSVDVLEM